MSVNSSSNQKQLLDELSKGSERAFTDLYNRYKNVVYSCALKITKSRTLSEEVVQDVFLKIWLKKETLTDIAHFESYIFVVARNHIFSMLKQIAKENTLKSKFNYNDISFDLTDAPLEEEEFTSLLNEIIKQLPPQQQKVYRMAKEEDLNYQQIGELLNISAMTAKKHLAQALKFIRIKLTNHINLILLGCFFTQN
ncbi:RNA polymerase sigma-70 factor, ECF subfamily [Flavobacterium sp. CF108]|uniref:RNA polymerase sigma factor n=1 Tax=Flavobacterium sp. CF108 TaxID=1882758 RepID=UPI000914399E|nr:sigma-70 family RNA polymerase sigma factor [Flavobacterium sp. CF108]SHH91700.1 RNA polymerase sigma-70 factor, ECF subfamily [Flavobacterium sp. CF108]